jgi:PIN domain nuclease of toxin-antitoxin system
MGGWPVILLDTHAWIWWVSDPSRLGKKAARAIRSARAIGVAAISCWEVATLVQKGRITLNRGALEWIEQSLALPGVELLPLTPAVAVRGSQLGPVFPGDPADRLIAATALVQSVPLVTKDERLQEVTFLTTVW